MYVFIGVYAHVSTGACGGQRRVSEPLDLELQSVVRYMTWEIGTNLVPLQEPCITLKH